MVYPLRHMPPELWKKAKIRAIEEGITMRMLIIRSLKTYIRQTPLLHESQLDAEIPPEEQEKAQAMAKDALGSIKEVSR